MMLDAASSPQGLWAVTGTPAAPLVHAENDVATEVAIVGGGFCGMSAALHLAERGVDATVIEAEAPGWGASGRNGGQVIAGVKLDPCEMVAAFGSERGQALHRFAAGTAELVFALIERFQIRCEPHRGGWIQAGRSRAVLAGIAARAADLQRQGEDVEHIDAARMAELTGTRFYGGGMLDRRSGSIQPLSFARGLAAAAVASGARVLPGVRIRRLRRHGAGWLLENSGPEIRARTVLLATNAYLGDLYPPLRKAMIPVESIQVATDPLEQDRDRQVLPSRLPVSDLVDLGVYFRRDDAGRFIIGGAGGLGGPTPDWLFRALAGRARALYPSLRPTDFTARWGGKLALTRDHLPRLVTPEVGLHAAYGCNGRGVALMTMLGKLAAMRIAGEESRGLPIAELPPAYYAVYALRVPAMLAARQFRLARRSLLHG